MVLLPVNGLKLASECMDVSSMEEMSIFCRWIENWLPVEHLIGSVSFSFTDALSICSTLAG